MNQSSKCCNEAVCEQAPSIDFCQPKICLGQFPPLCQFASQSRTSAMAMSACLSFIYISYRVPSILFAHNYLDEWLCGWTILPGWLVRRLERADGWRLCSAFLHYFPFQTPPICFYGSYVKTTSVFAFFIRTGLALAQSLAVLPPSVEHIMHICTCVYVYIYI